MLFKLWGNWEFAIDLRQWMVGFNFYRDYSQRHFPLMFNLFIGPFRLGYYKDRRMVGGYRKCG